MENLLHHVRLLQDLKRQHRISSFRFYTSDSQSILLELITEEIENWPKEIPFPFNLFRDLSNPRTLATNNIRGLCLLYKEILLLINKEKLY